MYEKAYLVVVALADKNIKNNYTISDELLLSIMKTKPIGELKKLNYELKKIIHMKETHKERKIKYRKIVK